MPNDYGADWARDHFTAPTSDGTIEVTWPLLDADADIICALTPQQWEQIAEQARTDSRVAQALHDALWTALDDAVQHARQPASAAVA